jgi:hypothetical protein
MSKAVLILPCLSYIYSYIYIHILQDLYIITSGDEVAAACEIDLINTDITTFRRTYAHTLTYSDTESVL